MYNAEHKDMFDKEEYFLNVFPVAQTLRATINKRDFLKLRSFCKAKNRVKQPNEWERIFTNPISDRGQLSKIYKELKILDIKGTNNPIK